MATDLWTVLTASCGTLALFAGIGLLMWIDYKGKAREKEFAHTERLKALEMGQPLPDADVARSEAEASRSRASGATAVLVPLGMAGAAVGATPLVLNQGAPHIHLPLLCVIWGVCGLVSLVTVSLGFETMRRRERSARKEERTPPAVAKQPSMDAIRAADAPSHPVG